MKHCAAILAASIATLAATTPFAGATGGFYEEPLPTLADYLRLDQLPAKTIEEIRDETAAPEPKVVPMNYPAELMALPKKRGPEALASLDKMIAAARTAALSPMLNLLNDLRDLYAGPAEAAESTAYLEWRLEQADQFGVNLTPLKEGEAEEEQKAPDKALFAEIDRQLAKASPAMKPHWAYLRAAAEYRSGDVPASEQSFQKVVKDFPRHPRAEAAFFMTLRCAIWRSRKPEYMQYDRQLDESERAKAKKLFDEYFVKYPRGRFYGDAMGWKGALAFDGGDYATALRCYTEQLTLADHPELIPSAALMVEKTLSWMAGDPQEKALAEVAKHPDAAQALAYLILNSSEGDNYNGKFETIDEVRGWRKKVLPRLATAIAAEQKRYDGATWKPRYLAMLALAASNSGQHEQAIKLTGGAGAALEKSDDLLFARGVALHRANRPAEAVAPLQQLLDRFPKSPLAAGARLRLGLALTDDHKAGAAVVALRKLLPKRDAQAAPGEPAANTEAEKSGLAEEPEYDEDDGHRIFTGISAEQVRGLIDTLLNFAPIAELAAPGLDANFDPVERLAFNEVIAQRLLAKEQFDEAKKYMVPAQWELIVGPLARLTAAAQAAKEPAAHAAACRKVGDAWAAARGRILTVPLDSDKTRHETYRSFAAEADGRRLVAAPFIGATGNLALDLENRDELRHAFNWWLEASDAQPGTPQTAQALWLALRAMPQIADVSPFTFERAVARKWTDTARKLYDRLRTEHASSEEAQRKAVAWDFARPKKPKPEEGEEEDDGSGIQRDPVGEKFSGVEALKLEIATQGSRDDAEGKKLMADILAFEKEAGGNDRAAIKARAETLRDAARKTFTDWNDLRSVNLLDDLALFFAEPDPGPKARELYVQLRFRFFRESAIGGGWTEPGADKQDEKLTTLIKGALADPGMKPVADYFEFLPLAIVANHFIFVEVKDTSKPAAAPQKPAEEEVPDDFMDKEGADTYRTHDYPLLAKLSAAFLEKYPQSKKREAAMLLHARAVFQSSREVVMKKYVTWPQGGRWEGGYESFPTAQEPFDAKRVLASLDAYEGAFPQGRYAEDIRDLRAAVALRQREWKKALELTLAQFEVGDDSALYSNAANRLGDIFALLADERYRADILPVIKANPQARTLLLKYLANDYDAHPLLYMKAWLREQLAAK